MIENFLYIVFIYFFLILALLVLIPFVINIKNYGIYGIKETFDLFKDKDFYSTVVIPVFVNFSIIYIFCSLIAVFF